MAPTIHLVRHAQGFHNLCEENWMIPDPTLTPLGTQQCADLKATFPFHDKITKIISSPLRRTIITAMAAFGREDLYPIKAVDTLQEVSNLPSDTGSPVNVLEAIYGNKIDLSRVSKDWTTKTPGSLFQPNIEKLEERAKCARLSIREIVDMDSDEHVVVMTHGDYLHFLTKDWQGVPELGFYVWRNGEYRSYQFDTSTKGVTEADLIETEQSWKRRHGDAARPSENDQSSWREPSYTKLRPEYDAMV